jgi:FkbM family methyltransferase
MRRTTSYSQFGQDFFVLDLFKGMHNGFFLDSGASNGIRANNTYLLETSYDWKGICIEPNEQYYEELRINRSCHHINCCLYNKDCEVDFVNAFTLGGILNEYDPWHLGFAKKVIDIPLEVNGQPKTVKKPALTLKTILKKFNAPKIIDYWSLDTEGSELTILKSFPFDEYSFKVLTVEHNYLPARNAIRKFLESHNYTRVGVLGFDDCYAKNVPVQIPGWKSSVWGKSKIHY